MESVHTRVRLLLAILLMPGISHAQASNKIKESTKKKEAVMSVTKQNEEAVRNLYEQSLNKRNMELHKDLISDEYTGPRGLKGVAGFDEPVLGLIKSFPDIQWKIQELLGEGNKVVVTWKIEGTHTGEFQHIAATGNKVSSGGMAIYEFKEGKIINVQVQTDRLDFLQQLNVLPRDITSLSNTKAQVRFIDKFIVPAAAVNEFTDRMNINRNFIKKLPGFIKDEAWQRPDEHGNLVCITIAVWENEDALKKAREVVQAEYKKQGFDMPAMLSRLNIVMDRGLYTEMEH
jgi:predicted ester cyclase/heme-degrading monooxygenase HmoA